MALALVPSPPRRQLAKGVCVDESAVRTLLRSEVAERRSLFEKEFSAREDVQFLIANARSQLRGCRQLPRSERGDAIQEVDRWLQLSPISNRVPKRQAEYRSATIAIRGPPSWMTDVIQEESELRDWIVRLEQRLRQEIASACERDTAYLLRFRHCEQDERTSRDSILHAESDAHRHLVKREFVDRPYGCHVFEVKRSPTFAELETSTRLEIEDEEQKLRKQAHDWLVLMYGVRLFSVIRTEDIERVEIEVSFEESHNAALLDMLHKTYRCPLMVMCAASSTASLVSQVAFMY